MQGIGAVADLASFSGLSAMISMVAVMAEVAITDLAFSKEDHHDDRPAHILYRKTDNEAQG